MAVKEIKAPDGYKASDEVFTAVVDENGKVTYAGSEDPPKCANIANDPDPVPDPEPPKPSVPTAPPVIRPTVTTVPGGTTTTTVKNTTTTTPPDTTTATTTTTTTTTPASAKTANPKKTTTAPETTASGKTTAKTTTPAADPPVTMTMAPAKADVNPETGVTVSFIPLTAAITVLAVTAKRKKNDFSLFGENRSADGIICPVGVLLSIERAGSLQLL